MRMLVWAGRETQDFASLLWLNAYVFSVLWHAHVGMGYSGDARFCVSTWLNAYMAKASLHAFGECLRHGGSASWQAEYAAPQYVPLPLQRSQVT